MVVAALGLSRTVTACIEVFNNVGSFEDLPFVSPVLWLDWVLIYDLTNNFTWKPVAYLSMVAGFCIYIACFWLSVGYGLLGYGTRQYEVLDVPQYCQNLGISWQTDPRRKHFVRLQIVIFASATLGALVGLYVLPRVMKRKVSQETQEAQVPQEDGPPLADGAPPAVGAAHEAGAPPEGETANNGGPRREDGAHEVEAPREGEPAPQAEVPLVDGPLRLEGNRTRRIQWGFLGRFSRRVIPHVKVPEFRRTAIPIKIPGFRKIEVPILVPQVPHLRASQVLLPIVWLFVVLPVFAGFLMSSILNGHSYLVLGQKGCYASFVSSRWGYLDLYLVEWEVKLATLIGLNC